MPQKNKRNAEDSSSRKGLSVRKGIKSRDRVRNRGEVFTELRNNGVAVFFSTHIISDIEKCADDIVYIAKGKIVAAMPKTGFIRQYSETGESLEDTMLRLEGGALHA